MAEPALSTFEALDQGLAEPVARTGAGIVQVARRHGGGSGLVWADDLVVSSSFHTPDRTQVGVDGGGAELELRDAEVIGRDAGSDIALLRVAGGSLTPAPVRELAGLAVGNLALALGRPGRSVRASLRAIGVLGPEVRTPAGGRLDRYIESDRRIPRGFAGGPLVDAAGAVVGMNTRTLLRGTDLAIPVVTIRRVVAELLAHGKIRRGYLGVGAYPAILPPALAALAGGPRGTLIASLDDDGPAATAGLGIGDVIVELDGVAVTGPESLRAVLVDRADAAVTVVVLRSGVRVEVAATIASRR